MSYRMNNGSFGKDKQPNAPDEKKYPLTEKINDQGTPRFRFKILSKQKDQIADFQQDNLMKDVALEVP